MRVFLVEDNAAMQRELALAVGAMKEAQVVRVEAAAQPAIDWLRANPEGWDLAIVDMFLAQGNGFEVLKSCRKALPHQRAVMMSNYGRDRDQVTGYARAAGADMFFDKSHDLDALIAYCKAAASDMGG